MKTSNRILPSQEFLNSIFIYDPETGELRNRITRSSTAKIGEIVGRKDRLGYRQTTIGPYRYLIHRIIWAMVNGSFPPGTLDHVNGIPSDNRIENLRMATPGQNAINCGMRKNNTSGIKGVCWHSRKKKWGASITLSRKQYTLGYFDNKKDAETAYQKASIKLHGNFRRNLQPS